MEETLDESISFNGFTPFIYVLREEECHNIHAYTSSGITLNDQCKEVERLDGKHYNEYNRKFYTSIR